MYKNTLGKENLQPEDNLIVAFLDSNGGSIKPSSKGLEVSA